MNMNQQTQFDPYAQYAQQGMQMPQQTMQMPDPSSAEYKKYYNQQKSGYNKNKEDYEKQQKLSGILGIGGEQRIIPKTYKYGNFTIDQNQYDQLMQLSSLGQMGLLSNSQAQSAIASLLSQPGNTQPNWDMLFDNSGYSDPYFESLQKPQEIDDAEYQAFKIAEEKAGGGIPGAIAKWSTKLNPLGLAGSELYKVADKQFNIYDKSRENAKYLPGWLQDDYESLYPAQDWYYKNALGIYNDNTMK